MFDSVSQMNSLEINSLRLFLASFLAMVCLILVIGTLIWKKLITMKLIEIERSLLKQLSDDGYQPGWHRLVMAPRASMSFDPVTGPPPYQN